MTATQVRVVRLGPALLLPLALIIGLLGVALALARVAPSRVTGGVYQVIVGEGPTRFMIPTESLRCNRNGDRAECTVPVAGKPLAVTIQYAGYDSACTARHGERMVPCESGLGDYGQASHTVWIADGLGAAEKDRPAVPWWRTSGGPTDAALALIVALASAAGLATYLLAGRPREHPLRTPAAVATGAAGLLLFAASSLIITTRGFAWPMLVAPPALIAAAALGLWQYQLAGPGSRGAKGIGAALATATFSAAALYVFLLHSGFID